MYDEAINVIIGDNGYGMTVKLEKARKIARRMRNPFVKKFADAMSGYVWLSSQINDYNEEFYNSSRILEQDDLVSLDDLIRRQYVVLSGHALKQQDTKRNMKTDGDLHIMFGESGKEFHEQEVDLQELENLTHALMTKLEQRKKR